MRRNIYVGATFLAILAALGVGVTMLQKRAAVEAATVQAPMFEVDPLWPKPLPNHWLMGMTIGVSVDAQDNIWIIHRQGSLEPGELHATSTPPVAMCCAPAPPVLEFDQDGNLLRHWGGPGNGYDWPDSNHGITVDYKGNVWIGGNGSGPESGRGAINGGDEEPGRPAVIQGAQQLLHTMTWLDRWPDSDHRTRIIFITQGIPRENLKDIIDVLDRVSSRTSKARARGRQALEAAKAATQAATAPSTTP